MDIKNIEKLISDRDVLAKKKELLAILDVESPFINGLEDFLLEYKTLKEYALMSLNKEIENLEIETTVPLPNIMEYVKANGTEPLIDVEKKFWEEVKETPVYSTLVDPTKKQNSHYIYLNGKKVVNPLMETELPTKEDIIGESFESSGQEFNKIKSNESSDSVFETLEKMLSPEVPKTLPTPILEVDYELNHLNALKQKALNGEIYDLDKLNIIDRSFANMRIDRIDSLDELYIYLENVKTHLKAHVGNPSPPSISILNPKFATEKQVEESIHYSNGSFYDFFINDSPEKENVKRLLKHYNSLSYNNYPDNYPPFINVRILGDKLLVAEFDKVSISKYTILD